MSSRENTERVDLNDYEASKQKLAEIRQAEADAKREAEGQARRDAEAGAIPAQRGPKRPDRATGKSRGRPKTAGSKRDVAERTGMSRDEQHRTERHVERAERFPFTPQLYA